MTTDFNITRGDTVILGAAITQAGAVYPLAGCSLWFTAKTAFSLPDVSAQFQKTIGNGITITDSPNGLLTVQINPADTSGLGNSKVLLLWDLQVKDSNGLIFTVANGNLVVSPDVTRAEA